MNQDSRPAATQWGRWLELTATWGKRGAAVLSKLRLVRPGRFIEFPIDLATILGAIAICCLLTGTFNSLGNADIRAAYARHIPTALQGATSSADAVNRLIDAGWADESLREWLKRNGIASCGCAKTCWRLRGPGSGTCGAGTAPASGLRSR